MIIDLANVGTNPKSLDVRFETREIDLEGEIMTLNGNPVLTGEIHREAERAVIEAAIDVETSIPCARCLEAIERQIEIPFRAVFIEPGDWNERMAEAELADEQLDESVAQHGKIDLAAVVREQLLLATPEQVFCREDCKGLCPQCGANLNLIDCKCADDEIDPRWAALKDIR